MAPTSEPGPTPLGKACLGINDIRRLARLSNSATPWEEESIQSWLKNRVQLVEGMARHSIDSMKQWRGKLAVNTFIEWFAITLNLRRFVATIGAVVLHAVGKERYNHCEHHDSKESEKGCSTAGRFANCFKLIKVGVILFITALASTVLLLSSHFDRAIDRRGWRKAMLGVDTLRWRKVAVWLFENGFIAS